MNNLVYFKSKEEGTLEALAFYEGSHIDSQGNAHIVTPDIIKSLAEKTNELLTQTDIPILTEHTKSPDNIRGVIKDTNSFIARPIDETDVQRNPKLSSALGKLGLFVSNIKLTDDNLLNKIKNGVGKTISCGIDFRNSLIREISLVAVNALPLASIFNNGEKLTYLNINSNKSNISNFTMPNNNVPTSNTDQETTAVTLEEALQDNSEQERIEAEAMQLLDVFLDVVNNIAAMSDEDLGNYQVASKQELYQQQLETFMSMLDDKINPFGDQQMMDQQNMQIDPRMQQQYQPQQQQYSYPLAITTFDEMDQYISEYGLGSMIKNAATGVMESGIGKKVIGGATNILDKPGVTNGIKKAKTAIANAASGGLNAAGKIGNKLANKQGILGKIGSKVKSGAENIADKLATRRLGRYSSNSKLARFVK